MQSAGIPCPLEPNMPDSYWQFMLGDTSKCEKWNNAGFNKETYLEQKYSWQNSKSLVRLIDFEVNFE